MWHNDLLTHQVRKNFYSHIPCGMWQYDCGWISGRFEFLLTHPVWDVTKICCSQRFVYIISTHTSRVGCDSWEFGCSRIVERFLLTHPVWDVTFFCCACWHWEKISTHTSRVGCDVGLATDEYLMWISTHTSRVGCDWQKVFFQNLKWISTHTSRVGCDRCTVWLGRHRKRFLLTHPVWDVTARSTAESSTK